MTQLLGNSFEEGRAALFELPTPQASIGLTARLSVAGEASSEQRLIEMLYLPGGYEILGEILKINPRELTPSGRIDYLAALEKQHSWLTSLIQDATLAIAGNEPTVSDEMWNGVDEAEREDVATALRLSPVTAQMRIDVARTLTNHLPETCSALAQGDISAAHATLIARESAEAIKRGIEPEALREIEAKAVAFSEFHTPAQVGRKLRSLIAQHTPEEFEIAREIAYDSRSVSLHHEGDGMSTVIALLPAEDAQTLFLAINSWIEYEDSKNPINVIDDFKYDALNGSVEAKAYNSQADSLKDESKDAKFGESSVNRSSSSRERVTNSSGNRTMNMKRADALAAIAADFLGRISADYTPHRRPVTLNVTIDLPTLLGLKENPANLAGYGPIPASIARELASDGRWRKFITDPSTGALLDVGRDMYIPPQYLVDFLSARDRTCRFPGCSQPARVCDIDHAISWEEGGETNPSNLGLLCRRHHRMKTHGGWKLESNPDGSCIWKSPDGKEFFVPMRPIHESA